jgi:hypothetical protein
MKSRISLKKMNLENEYNKFFSSPLSINTQQHETLEQPSPLKIVPSIATSGAYAEAIKSAKEIL